VRVGAVLLDKNVGEERGGVVLCNAVVVFFF
jgi:hypothetical protein